MKYLLIIISFFAIFSSLSARVSAEGACTGRLQGNNGNARCTKPAPGGYQPCTCGSPECDFSSVDCNPNSAYIDDDCGGCDSEDCTNSNFRCSRGPGCRWDSGAAQDPSLAAYCAPDQTVVNLHYATQQCNQFTLKGHLGTIDPATAPVVEVEEGELLKFNANIYGGSGAQTIERIYDFGDGLACRDSSWYNFYTKPSDPPGAKYREARNPIYFCDFGHQKILVDNDTSGTLPISGDRINVERAPYNNDCHYREGDNDDYTVSNCNCTFDSETKACDKFSYDRYVHKVYDRPPNGNYNDVYLVTHKARTDAFKTTNVNATGECYIKVKVKPKAKPPAPTIKGVPLCYNNGSNPSVNISWPSQTDVTYIDFSDQSNFATFSNKNVTGTTNTEVPGGLSPSLPAVRLQWGTTYYVRTYNGIHSDVASFTMPSTSNPCSGPPKYMLAGLVTSYCTGSTPPSFPAACTGGPQRVAGVKVTINGTGVPAGTLPYTSEVGGQFYFENLPAGGYTVCIDVPNMPSGYNRVCNYPRSDNINPYGTGCARVDLTDNYGSVNLVLSGGSCTAPTVTNAPTPTPTETLTPSVTATPTQPAPWIQLQNTSFQSSKPITNKIPSTPKEFDGSIGNEEVMIKVTGNNSPGVVSANGAISFGLNGNADVSQEHLRRPNYSSPAPDIRKFVDYLISRKQLNKITSLSNLQANKVNYIKDTDISITDNSMLTKLPSDTDAMTIVVDGGNVNINISGANKKFNPRGADDPKAISIIVVGGTLTINGNMSEVNAILIADTVNINDTTNQGLSIEGNLVTNNLLGVRKWTDNYRPGLFVSTNLDMYVNMLDEISTATYQWTELQ